MFNFDDLIRDSDIPKDEHGIPIISDDMSIATPAVSNKEILVHATDFFLEIKLFILGMIQKVRERV